MAFNQITKKFDIEYAREHTGWSYSEMKWLTEAEAEKANQERKDLLQSVSKGIQNQFKANKITTGPLSPGCMTCGQGTWSCIFIGSVCTANCFFCPQDRKKKKNHPPIESGLIFDNPEDYVDYLEKFNFKGASFSGGEPLLMFEKLLSYIRRIRKRMGKKFYIWVYTNGDLVDKDKLMALRKAGLNEIRFDIAARKYDLKKVEMAAGIIDTVTIEIPAIPEDYEILIKCLPEMKRIGVAHLNLHQLFANQYCYKQLIARRYTFLHQYDIPILESENAALRIIKYILENNIGLSVNYCCAIYKHRFQKTAYRKRFQPFVKKRYEGLTESGFIRSLAIHDTPQNLKNLVKLFQKSKNNESLWFLNEENSVLFFHHSLLNNINFNKYDLTITYLAPVLSDGCVDDGDIKKIALNSNRDIFVGKQLAYEMTIKNPATIKSFQELFIEKKNNGNVFKRFYENYELKTKADVAAMMNEKDRLDNVKTMEYIGTGLYNIY